MDGMGWMDGMKRDGRDVALASPKLVSLCLKLSRAYATTKPGSLMLPSGADVDVGMELPARLQALKKVGLRCRNSKTNRMDQFPHVVGESAFTVAFSRFKLLKRFPTSIQHTRPQQLANHRAFAQSSSTHTT